MPLKRCLTTFSTPTLHQFFVAELAGVLEVQQVDHQADGKAGAAGCGNASACDLQRGAEQAVLRNGPTFTHLAGEPRRHSRLDQHQGLPTGQHRQRVARINHLRQRLTKEIGLEHLQPPGIRI
jgi:hypothetical protein